VFLTLLPKSIAFPHSGHADASNKQKVSQAPQAMPTSRFMESPLPHFFGANGRASGFPASMFGKSLANCVGKRGVLEVGDGGRGNRRVNSSQASRRGELDAWLRVDAYHLV